MTSAPVPGTSVHLGPGAPLLLESAHVLFRPRPIRRHMMPSLLRLASGRLLLAFTEGSIPERANEGAILLSASDDDGATWDVPRPFHAVPGWFSLCMGGLTHIGGGRIRLVFGRIQLDRSLAGAEPITGWWCSGCTSTDGGESWTQPDPEIRLYPAWTEPSGGSNPHRLSDGRLLWSVTGTLGRDEGWQAGVTVSDADGREFSTVSPVAAVPGRDYSDIDLVRLPDGRFLAVVREHRTLQSVFSHSADDGRTWTAPRSTPFLAANVRLFLLQSGAVLCAYRDEDPTRRGVSCSVSDDGGETWRFIGQLYAADQGAAHVPGSVCGYPTIVSLGDGRLGCALHTYPTSAGSDLHYLVLRDLT